jgi:hypothetical protein
VRGRGERACGTLRLPRKGPPAAKVRDHALSKPAFIAADSSSKASAKEADGMADMSSKFREEAARYVFPR